MKIIKECNENVPWGFVLKKGCRKETKSMSVSSNKVYIQFGGLRVIMFGPKGRIMLQILPLYYDADAQHSAVFYVIINQS